MKRKIIKLSAFAAATLGLTVWTGVNFHGPLTQTEAARPEVLGAQTTRVSDIRGAVFDTVTHPKIATSTDTSLIKARSFLVYDAATDDILLKKNPDTKLSIASLTKLLTALVVYRSVDLRSQLVITTEDQLTTSPSLKLMNGDRITVSDLFNAMLVGSANDAARTLANYVEGSAQKNFIELMNETAASLGMDSSHFSNPLGFDSDQNYSTATDLKKLVRETQNLAAFTQLGRMKGYHFVSAEGHDYSVTATNRLISEHPEISAIKTGYTPSALGSLITKASISGHAVIIIVLESAQRETDTLLLENLVKQNFIWS